MLLTRCILPLSLLLAMTGCSGYEEGNAAFASRRGRALQPTYREQRQARAAAEALEENKKALGAVGADFLLRNDGTASKAHQVRFVASPGALTLDVAASPRLNLTSGAPHALRLVVYHLSDTAVMEQLAASEDGMKKLLMAERFDESVRSIRVLEIQPGQESRFALDRAENGRYVGLIAGYHALERTCAAAAVAYPLSQYVQQIDGVLFARKAAVFSPEPLHIQLTLGETAMEVLHSDAATLRLAEASTRTGDHLFAR